MSSAITLLRQCLASKEWNVYLDLFKLLYSDANYSEYYILMTPPFPITKRDILMCEVSELMYLVLKVQYVVTVSDTRTVVVQHSLPNSLLPVPNCIRSYLTGLCKIYWIHEKKLEAGIWRSIKIIQK